MGEGSVSEVAGGEVAVEPGELSRQTGPAQLDAPLQFYALLHAGEFDQIGLVAVVAAVMPVEQAPGVVLVSVGRERCTAQPAHERRHLVEAGGLFGQPPARRAVGGPAQIASGV